MIPFGVRYSPHEYIVKVFLDPWLDVVGVIIFDPATNRARYTEDPLSNYYEMAPSSCVVEQLPLCAIPHGQTSFPTDTFFCVLPRAWVRVSRVEIRDITQFAPGYYSLVDSTAALTRAIDFASATSVDVFARTLSSWPFATLPQDAKYKSSEPLVYLPIGTTVYVINHEFFSFGTDNELAAKITNSTENRKDVTSPRSAWYEVVFANGHESRVSLNSVIPTSEHFLKYCELYPSRVYVSTVDCGELFSKGDKFILRDKYLFNRNNQVQLLYSKFNSIFRQLDRNDSL